MTRKQIVIIFLELTKVVTVLKSKLSTGLTSVLKENKIIKVKIIFNIPIDYNYSMLLNVSKKVKTFHKTGVVPKSNESLCII